MFSIVICEFFLVLNVRPRGWHLPEKHVLVNGQPMSGSLFDFGLFLFHNARVLLDKGSGPYFYLPKLQNSEEAKLWADVFTFAEEKIGIPHGSIKCTVLIEHLLATFQVTLLYRSILFFFSASLFYKYLLMLILY